MKSVINTKLIQSPEDFVEMLYPYDMKLPVEKDMASLKLPLTIGRKTIPNRICIQPLEGFDSNEDGSPSELVHRRYTRFARTALSGRQPDAEKCCILCNNCFKLMNPGFSQTGCVIKDPDPYAAFYRSRVAGSGSRA